MEQRLDRFLRETPNQRMYSRDVGSNRVWPELSDTFQTIVGSVIPRLLGALKSDVRQIRPCLIHGDLREGNNGTEHNKGQTDIYDSAAYYPHNEMGTASWACKHRKLIYWVYRRQYPRRFDAGGL